MMLTRVLSLLTTDSQEGDYYATRDILIGVKNAAGRSKDRYCSSRSRQMRFDLNILCFLCLLVLGFAQDHAPSRQKASHAIGVEVGRKAPTFLSTDQLGQEQSNESLMGQGGMVLLFFRSADW